MLDKAVLLLIAYKGIHEGEHPTIVPDGALMEKEFTGGGGVIFSVALEEQPTESVTVIVLTPTDIPVTVRFPAAKTVEAGTGIQEMLYGEVPEYCSPPLMAICALLSVSAQLS
jgi:hypothetical protein